MQKHNTTQSDYWDGKAKKIASINIDMSPIEKKEIEDFFDFIKIGSSINILEVGCGAGRFTLPLLQKGHRITGIDVSPQSLDELRILARQKNIEKNLTLEKTDFEKPIFNNEFDLVIIGNVIHHFNPKKKREIMINIINSLKPGGKIAIFEPNAYHPLYLPWYLFLELSGRERGIWQAEKGVFKSKIKNIKKILLENNIKDIQTKRHTMIPLRVERTIRPIGKINSFLINIPLLKNLSAFFWIKGEKQ